MIAGTLEWPFSWVIQGLRLGAEGRALGQVLRPLKGRPLRVLAHGRALMRPLRAAGCEVYEACQEPDAICSAQLPPESIGAIGAVNAIRQWAEAVRPGGMVVLVTRRGRMPRHLLCAAFVHAGLTELSQQAAGLMIITAGHSRGGRNGELQKTCGDGPGMRSEVGAQPA